MGEGGDDGVRAVGGGEVGVVAGGDVGCGQLGAADRGDVLAGGWEVDGELLFAGKGDPLGGLLTDVAVGRAVVAGCGDDGLALGGGLLEGGVDGVVLRLAEVRLALAVADVEDGSDAVLDGPGERVEDAGGGVLADVDEVDGGAGSDAGGVLEIEVGFGLVAGVGGGLLPVLGTRMAVGALAVWPMAAWKLVTSVVETAD